MPESLFVTGIVVGATFVQAVSGFGSSSLIACAIVAPLLLPALGIGLMR